MTFFDIRTKLLGNGLSPQPVDRILSLPRPVPYTPDISPSSQVPSVLTLGNRLLGYAPIALTGRGIAIPKPKRMLSGWLVVLSSCLIPTIVIALDVPTRFLNRSHTLLTLAGICATIGLVLYVINMVLATRIKLVEDLFGGLNKVYIAHAVTGSLALIFILAHPVLLAVRAMPLGMHYAAALFVPSMKHLATTYGILGTALLLVLMIVTMYVRLPYKLWLLTHKYLGLAFLLICLHVMFEPNDLTGNMFMRSYLIVCIVIGLAAYTYRSLLPNLFVRRYRYVIQSAKEKMPGVVEVTLKPARQALTFEAGQFIFVSFVTDGLSAEWHPFTVSSAPDADALTIDVKSLGGYTRTLTRIMPNLAGMDVLVEGAYGRFSYRNVNNSKQVWIAGGIGITPFLSMAQSLGKGAYEVDLYYTVRTEAELIDLHKLANLQTDRPNQRFRVFPFVTQKYNRYLSADLIAANTPDIATRDFLICGPTPMMQALKSQLLQQGVSKHRIHTEEFFLT